MPRITRMKQAYLLPVFSSYRAIRGNSYRFFYFITYSAYIAWLSML